MQKPVVLQKQELELGGKSFSQSFLPFQYFIFFKLEFCFISNRRLAKLFRLVRLIKVAKLMKWIMRNGESRIPGDDDEDIDMKMSVVGRKMTERITKKG